MLFRSAGVFLKFGLELVFAIRDDVAIAGAMTVVFLALSAWPRGARIMPPLIGALLVGALVIAITGRFHPSQAIAFEIARPNLYLPAFSTQAMVELVLPLAITVLAVQNGQGFAVLKAAGHQPPLNAITTACGAGSIVAGLVGCSSTCLTGPVSAIISGGGEARRHYTAGLMVALLALVFGLFSPMFTRSMLEIGRAHV